MKTKQKGVAALLVCYMLHTGEAAMRINYLFGGKVLFQIILFFLFFFVFFGLESLKKHWKYEVVELHSEKRLDGLPVPAVTICPQNQQTQAGFKINITDTKGFGEEMISGNVLNFFCKNKAGNKLKMCIEDQA